MAMIIAIKYHLISVHIHQIIDQIKIEISDKDKIRRHLSQRTLSQSKSNSNYCNN